MKGWKTFAFNLTTGLIGLAIAALGEIPFAGEVPPWVGYTVSALSTINIGLRAVTSSPIFRD